MLIVIVVALTSVEPGGPKWRRFPIDRRTRSGESLPSRGRTPRRVPVSGRATKGNPANIPEPRPPERSGTRVLRMPAAERTVGNGICSEDASRCAGVGSLTTLRRTGAGVASRGECVSSAEKGRFSCGLRWRRGARENSEERTARRARAYQEPHQVSEVSSLWPNGRKQAREFGKMDPYLR